MRIKNIKINKEGGAFENYSPGDKALSVTILHDDGSTYTYAPDLGVMDAKKAITEDNLKCNFCYKPRKEVKKLIRNDECCICDDCVALCNRIILEEGLKERKNGLRLRFAETKTIMDDVLAGNKDCSDLRNELIKLSGHMAGLQFLQGVEEHTKDE